MTFPKYIRNFATSAVLLFVLNTLVLAVSAIDPQYYFQINTISSTEGPLTKEVFAPQAQWHYQTSHRANLHKINDVSFAFKLTEVNSSKKDTSENILQAIAIFVKNAYDVNTIPFIEHHVHDSIAWLNITDALVIAQSSDFRSICLERNSTLTFRNQSGIATSTNLHWCPVPVQNGIVELKIISENDYLLNKIIVINKKRVKIDAIPFIYKSTDTTFVISGELDDKAFIAPTYVRCQYTFFQCVFKPKITIYDESNALSLLPPSIFYILGASDIVIAALSIDYSGKKILIKTLVEWGHSGFPKHEDIYVQIKIYDSSSKQKHLYNIYGSRQPLEEKEFPFEVDYTVSFIAIEPQRVQFLNRDLLYYGSNEFKITPNGLQVLPPTMIYCFSERHYTIGSIYLDFENHKIHVKTARTDGQSGLPADGKPYLTVKVHDPLHHKVLSYDIKVSTTFVPEKQIDFGDNYTISIIAQNSQLVKIGTRNLNDFESTLIELIPKNDTVSASQRYPIFSETHNLGFVDVDYSAWKITVNTFNSTGRSGAPGNENAQVAVAIYDQYNREIHTYNIYDTDTPTERVQFGFKPGYKMSFIESPASNSLPTHKIEISSNSLKNQFADSTTPMNRLYQVLYQDLEFRPSLRENLYLKLLMGFLEKSLPAPSNTQKTDDESTPLAIEVIALGSS